MDIAELLTRAARPRPPTCFAQHIRFEGGQALEYLEGLEALEAQEAGTVIRAEAARIFGKEFNTGLTRDAVSAHLNRGCSCRRS